jgi:hypothetical protein
LVLDPIYKQGKVVGYLVQRTFLAPQGEKGAAKLALVEVMGLLRAEGVSVLSHGLAPAHNTRPGGSRGSLGEGGKRGEGGDTYRGRGEAWERDEGRREGGGGIGGVCCRHLLQTK